MTDMMIDVIQRGTAHAREGRSAGRTSPARRGRPATGATPGSCGFNADIAAAVWIGFDQERSLGENEEGGKTALPMWIYFMQEALRDKPRASPARAARRGAHVGFARDRGSRRAPARQGALFEAFLEQTRAATGLDGIQ